MPCTYARLSQVPTDFRSSTKRTHSPAKMIQSRTSRSGHHDLDSGRCRRVQEDCVFSYPHLAFHPLTEIERQLKFIGVKPGYTQLRNSVQRFLVVHIPGVHLNSRRVDRGDNFG